MARNNQPIPLVDEFENSFQACLAALTNPSSNHIHDSDEIKSSVDQTIGRFLDDARQMECFFLQKRLYLSTQKPEQLIVEDIEELKNEITRKDLIIQKYHEKVTSWQNILNDQPQTGAPGNAHPSGPLQGGPPQPQQAPVPMQPPSPMRGPHPNQMMGQPGPQGPQGMQHMRPQGPPGPHMRHPGQHPGGPQGPPQHVMQGHPGMQGPGGQGPPQHMMQGHPGGAPQGVVGMGPGMGQHSQAPGPPMGGHGQFMGQGGPSQQPSPLAYLERTTSNIGMPDVRR